MVRRLLVLGLVALLTACTGAGDGEAGPASPQPPASVAESAEGTTTEPTTPTTPTDPITEPEPEPPHPVSLGALMQRQYDGRALRLRAETARTATYSEHTVTYRSGDLTVSGVLAVPHGRGPFPALVLAHGYIDPVVYVTGQGLVRERAWFAERGFVTLHVDYRNHAASDDDPRADLGLRLGYAEDVVNAVLALRGWRGPVDDERVGLVGRSMGGGVIYNALVAQPGLVDAAVVFAPVSSDAADNFERWIRPDPGRSGLAARILRRYGEPGDNREFWRGASARTYFDEITEPVLIHHGTSDDICPLVWSRETARLMRRAGVDVTLAVYPGEEHAFVPQWPLAMERTTAFLRRHLS
jgi:dipeptidyl aminopeptidase/acylaminoacyl peptidase